MNITDGIKNLAYAISTQVISSLTHNDDQREAVRVVRARIKKQEDKH